LRTADPLIKVSATIAHHCNGGCVVRSVNTDSARTKQPATNTATMYKRARIVPECAVG